MTCNDLGRSRAEEGEEDDDEEYEDEEEEEEEGEEGPATPVEAEVVDGEVDSAAGSRDAEDIDADDDEDYSDLSKGTFFCAEVKASGLPVGPGVPTEVQAPHPCKAPCAAGAVHLPHCILSSQAEAQPARPGAIDTDDKQQIAAHWAHCPHCFACAQEELFAGLNCQPGFVCSRSELSQDLRALLQSGLFANVDARVQNKGRGKCTLNFTFSENLWQPIKSFKACPRFFHCTSASRRTHTACPARG